MSAAAIKAHVQTIAVLCSALTATQALLPESQQVPAPVWEEPVLVICQQVLEGFVRRSGAEAAQDSAEAVVRCLFTAGEVVLVALTANKQPAEPDAAAESTHAASSLSASRLQRSGKAVPPALLTLVQTLTAPSLSLPSSLAASPVSSSIRAHAFISLGKLCLRDAALAKRSLPLFVRELSNSGGDVVLRNNLLILLSDLCRCFTSLVDSQLPALTCCLHDDGSPLLRRHALLILCQLLQEDYLKPKPQLLLPLLSTLCDTDPAIAALARSSLSHLLTAQTGRAHASFVDSLFFLNGCAASLSSSAHCDPLLSVPSFSRRNCVYELLLSLLSDEQRLMTQRALCQEILQPLVDGRLQLEAQGVGQVLHDTLAVLSCDGMRVQAVRGDGGKGGDDEAEAEAEGGAEEGYRVAKGRLLGKLQKRSVLEQLLPVLMELKRSLESRQSPLVQRVLDCLRGLHADFKGELMDVLAQDRQLQVEFQYDMKRMEDERKEKEKQRRSGSRAGSSGKPGQRRRGSEAEQAAPRLSLQNVIVNSSPAASRKPASSAASAAAADGSSAGGDA